MSAGGARGGAAGAGARAPVHAVAEVAALRPSLSSSFYYHHYNIVVTC